MCYWLLAAKTLTNTSHTYEQQNFHSIDAHFQLKVNALQYRSTEKGFPDFVILILFYGGRDEERATF